MNDASAANPSEYHVSATLRKKNKIILLFVIDTYLFQLVLNTKLTQIRYNLLTKKIKKIYSENWLCF